MQAFSLPKSATGPMFRDVSVNTPNRGAIETVAGDGILSGTSLFTFSPNQIATRLDLAKALVAEV